MSVVQLGAERAPHDLTHFVYTTGHVGNLKVLSHTYVLPGDSVEIDAIGAFRLSPLRRGLAVDSKVELFTFYVPFRYNYGNDAWNAFLLEGAWDGAPLVAPWTGEEPAIAAEFSGALGIHNWGGEYPIPFPLADSYLKIWNRYFRVPSEPEASWNYPRLLQAWCGNGDFAKEKASGFGCALLKTPWSASLAADTMVESNSDQVSGTLDLIRLNQEYAALHTEEERTHFMRYYADVVESFGGHASRDSEQRPHLLMHTEFWASGYDVDGTASDNLGQFSGRVQQSFRHEVPRFFVPEHGQIITLALCRFPSTVMGERDYLDTLFAGTPSYDMVSGDSAIVANSAALEIPTASVLPGVYSTPDFKLPHSWYYRYQPSRVSDRFVDIEGFPFIDPRDWPVGWNPRYSVPSLYEAIFQSQQLDDWNIQSKFNVNILRDLPSARESIMTS